MDHDERPGWSITWLFRIQRRGRHLPPDAPANGFHKWFPWAVVAALLVEIALLVWIGVLPR